MRNINLVDTYIQEEILQQITTSCNITYAIDYYNSNNDINVTFFIELDGYTAFLGVNFINISMTSDNSCSAVIQQNDYLLPNELCDSTLDNLHILFKIMSTMVALNDILPLDENIVI